MLDFLLLLAAFLLFIYGAWKLKGDRLLQPMAAGLAFWVLVHLIDAGQAVNW